MENRWLKVSSTEPLDREVVLFSWGRDGDGLVGYIRAPKESLPFFVIGGDVWDGGIDPTWFLRIPKLPPPPV